jgi:hypothetical protein
MYVLDNVICFREWLQKFEFKKFMMLLGLNLGLDVISTTLRPDQCQGETRRTWMLYDVRPKPRH